eukprot:TRINITY_DN59799_c0_g1_i1.p2 TRINITY_DN59799_c0_g1~~TRINITY_DN59799_c0_g1_i1.p2  ORF type:complete len:140 (-),score=10.34 TRINITY_DN59799_c0_g1_i1:390-809(-)
MENYSVRPPEKQVSTIARLQEHVKVVDGHQLISGLRLHKLKNEIQRIKEREKLENASRTVSTSGLIEGTQQDIEDCLKPKNFVQQTQEFIDVVVEYEMKNKTILGKIITQKSAKGINCLVFSSTFVDSQTIDQVCVVSQ